MIYADKARGTSRSCSALQLPRGSSSVTATPATTVVAYGLQDLAVRGMLAFDYICQRKKPSVAALVFPFPENHFVKFHWGTE